MTTTPNRQKKPTTAIRSWSGYATVLRSLQRKPATARRLSERLKADYYGVCTILAKMRELGLAHEIAWEPAPPSSYVAVYAAGAGERVPRPGSGTLPQPISRSHRSRPEIVAFANIYRALESEPITLVNLAEVTGCSYNNLVKLLRHCEAIGLARIADWQPGIGGGIGGPSAMWALGAGAPAPKPAPMPDTERYRRYRQAKKAKAQAARLLSALAGRASKQVEEATA